MRNGTRQPNGDPFHPRDAVDLLENPPEQPQDLLLPGLLWKGSKLLLSAPWKAGKSTLSLQLALGLAHAQPLFEPLEVPSPCKTMYVQLEMDEYIVYERLAGTQVRPEPGQLFVASPRSLKIDDDTDLLRLKNRIVRLNPDVLILDPLYKLHNRNENDAGDMQIVFDKLDELVYDYRLGLIIVHHQRKEHLGPGGDQSRPEERARGTSKLEDWPDTLVAMQVDRRNDLRTLTFTCRRNPDMEDVVLRFNRESWRYEAVVDMHDHVDELAEHVLPLARQEFLKRLVDGLDLNSGQAESQLKRLQRQDKVATRPMDGARHGEVEVCWAR